ncbi:hypothetical protein ACFLUK_02900 [Chloroflexota bacterium]
MNIRHPSAVGMALGVAHIMTKLGQFATQITLQRFFPLTIGLGLQ